MAELVGISALLLIFLTVLLAGGGFKHGAHHAFKTDNNAPLCNLFVSMMQRMGVEAESFVSSSGRAPACLSSWVVSRVLAHPRTERSLPGGSVWS